MHNAIVKFRKNPDIRNHFAENRANNKDNAPDAAGSPFRIRTRPPLSQPERSAMTARRRAGRTLTQDALYGSKAIPAFTCPTAGNGRFPRTLRQEKSGGRSSAGRRTRSLPPRTARQACPILGPASGVPAGVGISILPTLLS